MRVSLASGLLAVWFCNVAVNGHDLLTELKRFESESDSVGIDQDDTSSRSHEFCEVWRKLDPEGHLVSRPYKQRNEPRSPYRPFRNKYRNYGPKRPSAGPSKTTPEIEDAVTRAHYEVNEKLQKNISGGDPVGDEIKGAGFTFDPHFVESEDGYELRMLRLINPLANKKLVRSRPPVAISHGLMLTYSAFIVQSTRETRPQPFPLPANHQWNSRNRSLALYLSNLGYDVWLLSARGSDAFSKGHNKAKATKDYWDFSLDEQGQYDLPALIDMILKVSGHQVINYIGYSESTLFMFIALSHNPDIAKKILTFYALAPVINMKYVRGIVGVLTPYLAQHFPHYNVETFHPIISEPFAVITAYMCQLPIFKFGCQWALDLVTGESRTEVMDVRAMRHNFRPTSLKSYIHFMQIIARKQLSTFERWDDCSIVSQCSWENQHQSLLCKLLAMLRLINLRLLCRSHTPSKAYNLSQINLVNEYIQVFSGFTDTLSTCEEAIDLYYRTQATNPVVNEINLIPGYNHMDLVFASNVDQFVNEKIWKHMDDVTNKYMNNYQRYIGPASRFWPRPQERERRNRTGPFPRVRWPWARPSHWWSWQSIASHRQMIYNNNNDNNNNNNYRGRGARLRDGPYEFGYDY